MIVFVSPHAIERYQERIYRAGQEQVRREIEAALAQPLFSVACQTDALTLWGVRNQYGHAFVVATDPADAGAPFLLVRTCGPAWWWKECRPAWRRIGVRAGYKGGRGGRRRDRLSCAV